MLARLILFGSVLALASGLFAQTKAVPAKPAQANTTPGSPDWSEPFPPHRMIGNIYYVGSRGLATYLITTPAGHLSLIHI